MLYNKNAITPLVYLKSLKLKQPKKKLIRPLLFKRNSYPMDSDLHDDGALHPLNYQGRMIMIMSF